MDILKAQRLDGHQTLHSFLASTSEYRLWGENHVLKLAPVLKHRPGLTRTDWTLDIVCLIGNIGKRATTVDQGSWGSMIDATLPQTEAMALTVLPPR